MKSKKIIGIVALSTLLATPALALESKVKGFINLRAIGNNFAASNNYVGTLDDTSRDETLIDQRFRLKFKGKVNENLSFLYYGEVDFQWGDESYSNSGRNDGGGLGGDTTNVETKNVYMDVHVDTYDSNLHLGLQGFDDKFDYTFVASDMAGIKYNGKFGGMEVTAGWFKLLEGDFAVSDDVSLWAIQTDFNPTDSLSLGLDYYYYQSGENLGYGTFFGTTDIDAVLDGGAGTTESWTSDRKGMDLNYIGGRGSFDFGKMTLSGWVNVNAGEVQNVHSDLSAPTAAQDLDVLGYSGRVKLGGDLGNLKLNLSTSYFSGDDDLTDGDATFVVVPTSTESFAFADDGFMIFTPDQEWNSVGQYGFAMSDAAWAGLGLTTVVFTGNYTSQAVPELSFNFGAGYFASVYDKLAVNDPRTDRAGTQLGSEYFLRIHYLFAENLDLSLAGSYAVLGDFYDNNGGGTAVNDATSDIDNPYEVYLKGTLSF